ncbi:hypothetical protein GGI15_000636 [Coemansia interrupta]|uniref:Uncharacterized protein n=1 Tax=Coemansia interrupta TaxID=1126814 RepID=A0A9W8HRU1_9FUNG|nr:hypothetical protein GGI15_000636 [Coemansia interrupta]
MISSVPDYILSSGVIAQQTRGRSGRSGRRSSLSSQTSTMSEDAVYPVEETSSEIKAVLGMIAAPQRGWLQKQACDVPRLVHF